MGTLDGHMMGGLSDDEYTKMSDILDQIEVPHVLEFDGVIFLGERIEVVKRYIKLNPSKSFYVWCHDNLPILTIGETNIKK